MPAKFNTAVSYMEQPKVELPFITLQVMVG